MMGFLRTASAALGERGSFLVPKVSQAPLHCPPICLLTVHCSVLGSGSPLHLAQNVFRREADVLHRNCFCSKAQEYVISACLPQSPSKSFLTFNPFDFTALVIFVNRQSLNDFSCSDPQLTHWQSAILIWDTPPKTKKATDPQIFRKTGCRSTINIAPGF